MKIKELYGYSRVADHECIRALHERLISYAHFMNKVDKGCLNLTFGRDIKPGMSTEELNFINSSY